MNYYAYHKAFTLVELIVVITILAILGTIAFISLSGYAMEARNTTIKTGLKGIDKAISLQIAKGGSYSEFISGTGAQVNDANLSIGGSTDSSNFSGTYIAGDVDFLALEINASDYVSDSFPDGVFKMGYTSIGNRYQLAATIEGQNDLDAYFIGNYSGRTATENRVVRDTSVGGNVAQNNGVIDNIFYISGPDYNERELYVGDRVGIGSGTYRIIDLVGGNEVHVDQTITTPGGSLYLRADEMRGLIKRHGTDTSPAEAGRGEDYVPYK